MAPSVDPEILAAITRGRIRRVLFLPTLPTYRSDPSRPRTNQVGALGGELLVAVRFFVDLDQGGAAASGTKLALPSIIRGAQQCRHRSE